MFVSAGSKRQQATSPSASSRSSPSRSLISTTRVVRLGSTGAPMLCGREAMPPSVRTAKVSSTEPW